MEHQDKLDAFKAKAKLTDADRANDALCFRFLRARQYDVDKAVAMYDAYITWRTENNIDAVLSEGFCVDKELWQHSFHGHDKQGRPIFIERLGRTDVKKLTKAGHTIDSCVRAHCFQQEYMAAMSEASSKINGQHIEQAVSIMDLDGSSVFTHLSSISREFYSRLAGIGQNYYPERLGKLVVVNAPRAFPMAWSFISPFLDEKTKKKIEIHSSTKSSSAALAELIDKEFIPKEFGGECDCEANKCYTSPSPADPVNALRYTRQESG
eukprot:TRINITY_DN996_c0_g1_i1.p1 TRINITY_DN996_c0_g1~~TRINITY_DN996_c0_g1_i1.p1  ORF type:complete len:266 (+),score=60.68 TRINITY_DN996_c0_g1_i1:119-916(+)